MWRWKTYDIDRVYFKFVVWLLNTLVVESITGSVRSSSFYRKSEKVVPDQARPKS